MAGFLRAKHRQNSSLLEALYVPSLPFPNSPPSIILTYSFFTVAEEDAPTGMLARGHYTAVSTFIDDDKKRHLEFEWAFDIAKEW